MLVPLGLAQAQELEDLVKEKFVDQKLLQVDYDSMELLECKHVHVFKFLDVHDEGPG